MPKNKLSDLRDHLFETIEALKDPDKPMDIARAKAISEVAQTVINSAKVELEAVEILGLEGEGARAFFPERLEGRPQLGAKVSSANKLNGS